ncbi:MAG: phage tail sheath subtilisin-like domain-containing protein, partial [Thermoanaerobaculia bacterium]|nr:phage tail sheath subtilisin-like domain-containing protein [Thermoanaerobaculia bacterium]
SRISDLGFHPDHTRFWGHLPSDEELFVLDEGRSVPIRPPEVESLRSEAAEPRFPFSGPEDRGEASWYLPISELGGDGASGLFELMASDPDPARTRGPSDLTGLRLERDGLASFGSGLFLDEDLQRNFRGALLGAAEHKRYLRGETLEGLYALLPVAEATLIAVPDAVHREWHTGQPELPELLGAPEIETVIELDGTLEIRWTEVPGAREYRLETAGATDFELPETVFEGNRRRALVAVVGCPSARFFRVRAHRGGEIGPWSATVLRIVPRPDFRTCGALPLVATRLERAPAAGGGDLLTWDAVPGATAYRVESAEEPGFLTPRTIHEGPDTHLELPPQLDGVAYLRVAALRHSGSSLLVGPRSNTVVRRPVARSRQVLVPASGEAPHLLDVQRALLRFSAARGDLLALLSLPRHFRQEEARRHLAALAPLTGSADAASNAATFRAVPPLTGGEEQVLSYGALYHPWLAAVEEGDFAVTPGFVPPEGAVAGTAAELAVDRGAWWAPANLPLAGTVALDPDFDRDAWQRLAEIGINVVRREPRGFLAQGADTLSRGAKLRPISVRRLMILIRRLALREGGRYVFEPHDADFQSLVQHRFERFLSGLHVRGAFAGRTAADAFRVVTDASVNPPRSVDAGRFIVELQVAPSRPLDFLTVRLVQTGPEQLSLQEA